MELSRYPKAGECGAKNRQGKPCRQPAMPNGRCYYHGGKSLSGPAHGMYKHGLRSKEYLEQRRQFNQLLREARELLEELEV